MHSIRLSLFTDASFANAENGKSQLYLVLILKDRNNRANVIHFGGTRCHRIARSVLTARIFGRVCGFDNAFSVQTALKEILNKTLPINVFIDSRTLFNFVAKEGNTKGKRLQIDISALRESYTGDELNTLSWILSDQKITDATIKFSISKCSAFFKLSRS